MLQEIRIENIYVSETAAQNARRKHFKNGELDELKASIAEHGVLQPIIVRPAGANGSPYTHELVAGERRFLASEALGLETIPAVVRELTDEKVIEVQLIENLQRKDLHPMQEAEGYQELMQKHGHPVEELHERVGKSRSYVYGRIKLLALCKEARQAFYEDRISASVAILIARIPSDKLQKNALADLCQDDDSQPTARGAKELIQSEYMLRLKGCGFPLDDPEINGKAGPCTSCPKRTGNQAELFADIESADVCTDVLCFRGKKKAAGERRIKEAQAAGQPVLTGKQAKELTRYGTHYFPGYKRLDEQDYAGGKYKKVRNIVGPDAEVTLLLVPDTGDVMELVKSSIVQAASKKADKQLAKKNRSTPNPISSEERKRKIEKKFRRALYDLVRPSIPAPGIRDVVEGVVMRRLLSDDAREICTLLAIEPAKTTYGRSYRDAVDKHVKTLTDEQLWGFLNDMLLVPEVSVPAYHVSKATRLLAAAATQGVNIKALRKSVTPAAKKKASKKTAKKKASKKATKKKTRKRKAA